jgi:hypothetical protein
MLKIPYGDDMSWQKELYDKYPKLFRQKDLPATDTCMCWGICCGGGWKDIIEEACEAITKLNNEYSQFTVEFTQVKEKFAGLRLYYQVKSPTIDYVGTNAALAHQLAEKVFEIVNLAEEKSYRTCEVCGAPGKESGTSWIQTLCDEHAPKNLPTE